jgi:hypothetical protein
MGPIKRHSTHQVGEGPPRVRARGSFGYVPTPGLASHHWPPRSHETPLLGLPPAGQHLWGSIRYGDRLAFPIRQFQNELAVRFFLFEGAPAGRLDFHDASESGYHGICTVGEHEQRWGPRQPGRAMRFAFLTNETSARWRESEACDLIGTPLHDALQFAIPDAEEPFVYLARAWKVREGTVLGHPVSDGFFFQEQVYLPPGLGWFTSRYFQSLQKVWITFATEFEDGATLFGQLKVGHDGFGFAVIQRSDGPPIATNRLSCDVTLDVDGYCESVIFHLFGSESWQWRPATADSGRMPLPDAAGPRWRDGIVTRLGDTRTVKAANGWSEVYPYRL